MMTINSDLNRFTSIQNYFSSVNFLYIVVSIILIAFGNYVRTYTYPFVTNTVYGLIFCGILLCIASVLGFVSATKQNHAGLVFYMILLSIVFFTQLLVSINCIGNADILDLRDGVKRQWNASDDEQIWLFESSFDCCGLTSTMDMAVNCTKLRCSKNKDCDPCLNVISTKIIEILLLAAAVSIATSIFNWIGIFGGYKFKQALNEYWEDQISISGEESDSEYYYE